MLSAGDPSSLAGPANLNKDIEDEIGKSISVPSAGQNEGFPPQVQAYYALMHSHQTLRSNNTAHTQTASFGSGNAPRPVDVRA